MQRILKRAIFIFLAIFELLFLLISFNGCGIYTTLGSLNPPFDHSRGVNSLIFSGYNPEPYFWGYVIWYKESEDRPYTPCGYKNKIAFPTIPKNAGPDYVSQTDYTMDPDNPRIVYTVSIQDLYPQENLTKSFYTLWGEEQKRFYFAVSSYGINGEESEKVEFGIWPY
jgi:hypothetical protein